MLAANLFLAGLVLSAGLFGLIVFFVALFKGLFDHPNEQANSIFDEHDRRFWRAWETANQQAERRNEFGIPLNPPPGEWGGAR